MDGEHEVIEIVKGQDGLQVLWEQYPEFRFRKYDYDALCNLFIEHELHIYRIDGVEQLQYLWVKSTRS